MHCGAPKGHECLEISLRSEKILLSIEKKYKSFKKAKRRRNEKPKEEELRSD